MIGDLNDGDLNASLDSRVTAVTIFIFFRGDSLDDTMYSSIFKLKRHSRRHFGRTRYRKAP
jgi:hypothetical protein